MSQNKSIKQSTETRGGGAYEFEIEMLGDSFGNVEVWGISKKYHTPFNQTNRIATIIHYNPIDIPDSTLKHIADFGIEIYKSVGLHTSFGTLEVLLDSEGGIHPLDLGARTSGFIGRDLMDAINPPRVFINEYLDVIRGKKIGNGYTANKNLSSMLVYYDLGNCTIKRESNLMEFLPPTIKNINHDRSALKVGNQLRIPSKDVERSAFEIISGKRTDLTIETILDAEERFAKFATE